MNIKNPLALALALLMTTSTAMAQTSVLPNLTFKDMTDPAGSFAGTQFLGNQSNPLTANDEFFKKCGTVPYRLCTESEQKQRDEWEAQQKKDSAGDQAALEKRMAEQKKLTPDLKIVDMGDGKSFGIVDGDTISIDNGSSCGIPRKMTDAEKSKIAGQDAKEKEKQAAKEKEDSSTNGDKNGLKINDGKGAINGGFSANENKSNKNTGGADTGGNTPSLTNAGRTGTGFSGASDDTDTPSTNSDGNNDGKSLADTIRSTMGGDSAFTSKSAPSSGSGRTGTSGSFASGGNDTAAVIRIDGRVAAAQAAKLPGYSFNGVRNAAEVSDRILKGGDLGDRAGDAKRVTVDSTLGGGKPAGRQAVANGSDE